MSKLIALILTALVLIKVEALQNERNTTSCKCTRSLQSCECQKSSMHYATSPVVNTTLSQVTSNQMSSLRLDACTSRCMQICIGITTQQCQQACQNLCNQNNAEQVIMSSSQLTQPRNIPAAAGNDIPKTSIQPQVFQNIQQRNQIVQQPSSPSVLNVPGPVVQPKAAPMTEQVSEQVVQPASQTVLQYQGAITQPDSALMVQQVMQPGNRQIPQPAIQQVPRPMERIPEQIIQQGLGPVIQQVQMPVIQEASEPVTKQIVRPNQQLLEKSVGPVNEESLATSMQQPARQIVQQQITEPFVQQPSARIDMPKFPSPAKQFFTLPNEPQIILPTMQQRTHLPPPPLLQSSAQPLPILSAKQMQTALPESTQQAPNCVGYCKESCMQQCMQKQLLFRCTPSCVKSCDHNCATRMPLAEQPQQTSEPQAAQQVSVQPNAVPVVQPNFAPLMQSNIAPIMHRNSVASMQPNVASVAPVVQAKVMQPMQPNVPVVQPNFVPVAYSNSAPILQTKIMSVTPVVQQPMQDSAANMQSNVLAITQQQDVPQQTVECVRSPDSSECTCPKGFRICTTPSNRSNQCCR